MQTLNTAFEQALTKLMDEEIEAARERISAGQMTPEDYRFQCGKLAGMRDVLGYFEIVNKLLSER
jgi:hypothetical protein